MEIEAALRDPRVLWTEDVLRFADTDAIGHINNTTFSVLCESGRVHLLETRINPAVPTGAWIARIGRSSLVFEQMIMSEGRLAATSEAVCVLMGDATRRPVAFPEESRRAIEALLRAPDAEGPTSSTL